MGPTPVEPFQVLFVCTANVCRSPIAEHLLWAELSTRLGPAAAGSWRVASAGTRAIAGTPVHPYAEQVLAERGIPCWSSGARRLDESMVEQSQLILTAGRSHRAKVVEMVPASVRRTFTLRQFARLCRAGRSVTAAAPARRGEDLLAAAARGRRNVQPVEEPFDSVDDPMGQGIEAFRETRGLIERCLVDALGGSA